MFKSLHVPKVVFSDDKNFSILEVSEKTVSNSLLNRRHLRSIA